MAHAEMLRKGAAAFCMASLILALCACTATQQPPAASQEATASTESRPASAEGGSQDAPEAATEEGAASGTGASSDSSSEPSSGSASSSSPSSSSAASASSEAAFRLLPSPELLTKSSSASAAADAAVNDDGFAYEGAFAGSLEADGQLVESYGEVIESAAAGSTAALARNGGTLVMADGKLVKIGQDTSIDDALAYGTDAAALAVNADSNMLLSSVIAESACPGAPGLFSCDGGSSYADDVTISTAGDDSAAVRTTSGGTMVGNALHTQTEGARSPSLACASPRSTLSVTNSSFQTAGSLSPILQSRGRIEADNIVGASGASPLAVLEDQGTALISNSRLSSTSIDGSANGGIPCAVMLYRAEAADRTTEDDSALFQASDSTLESTIRSGAFFYLTNTRARVLLSNNRLLFDEGQAVLLRAEGNNSRGWGSSGKNGALCDITARNQKLRGAVESDSLSSVDLYLLENSQWTGSSSIRSNTSGSAVGENLNVSIDGTSSWTVTGNSTVTNINLAEGGKLVDTRGRSVKLVDQNGFTLVDGASDTTVTVNGSFSTTVKTAAANDWEEPAIDRTAFDATFGTQTAFGSNGTSAYTAEEQRVAELMETVKAWFARL